MNECKIIIDTDRHIILRKDQKSSEKIVRRESHGCPNATEYALACMVRDLRANAPTRTARSRPAPHADILG